MGIIAVAGGTGSVGRTIVEALIEHGKHKVIVLSRKPPSSADIFDTLQVDYNDIEATASSFEAQNIDTVICAFGMVSDESSDTQIKLIHAANQSSCTRRFVVSEFDMLFKEEHIPYIPTAKWAFDALRVIEKTDLEHTRVVNGMFLDYYGLPHWKTEWAVIPGDGETGVSFITTQDLGRFVARLMDVEEWPPVSCFAGVTASFNEILSIAEKARGEKFSVKYEDLETLEKGKISFPEFEDAGFEGSGHSDEAIFALFHRFAAMGDYYVPPERALDGRFPDVKVTTAEELMTVWRGR
ncbi:NAD(P)-binding protein [Aspergillus steynii IBT 23096]|uniref:NAD(P)-binding protein n=1 Tax=Aspergillus steynii IBT 23096 TaxID=1392250 RepID=A0A2I2GAI4_9EURO|nr:NAD(P)-binding protein [Aspergillus steynii IBT 23096]PLB49880.1 NAD(P)-binding protein [Aspergillus steynii IBT 23096]